MIILKKINVSALAVFVLFFFNVICTSESRAEITNGETKAVVTSPEDLNTMQDNANTKSVEDKSTVVEENVPDDKAAKENYFWLSDLDFSAKKSGWGGENGVRKDCNFSGQPLTLKVDGVNTTFKKGIFVHADGYAQFDISKLSDLYPRFVTTVGIDQTRGNKGEVVFYIQVSQDGKNWTTLKESQVQRGSSNAEDIEVNVKGYKQLRLWANSHGANSSDHAVFGGARLIKQDYDLNSENYHGIKTLSEYDQDIDKLGAENVIASHKTLLNKRELVNRLSYRGIQNSVRDNKKVKNALDWILSDDDALELLIEAGNIDQPVRFMTALGNLYNDHKADLKDPNNKEIYKKMMIAAAVGWSSDIYTSPLTFSMPLPSYDISERYAIMKDLYDKKQFPRMDEFTTYDMEHLRMVMTDSIANNELRWLNGYSQTKGNQRLNIWGYGIKYRRPTYGDENLYDLNNKDLYDSKYQLSKYNIPFGDKPNRRTWMVMEIGGICWNTSRFGQNLLKSNGIASVGVFQPKHEAVIHYAKQDDGKGKWTITNNISGWKASRTVWTGGSGYRMLLDWGDKPFIIKNSNSSNNASYTLLAQAALDSGKFVESNRYNMVAKSEKSSQERIASYERALDILPINLDSFEGIIDEYNNQSMTSNQWNLLGEKIIKAYTFYPYAMIDLLKLVTPHLQGADIANIDILKTQALEKATKATKEDTYQYQDAIAIAKNLLNNNREDFASFSFDGENENKIIINDKYKDVGLDILYSVDGGKKWIEAGNVKDITLSAEQLKVVNENDDLKLCVKGSNAIFNIDIQKGQAPTKVVVNDFENRLLGPVENLEVSTNNGESWTDYNNQRFEGDQSVLARYKAHGMYSQGDFSKFDFHLDNYDSIKKGLKYITYDRIKLSDFSSQQSESASHAAKNMLDGLTNTSWHTKFGIGSDKELFYTVEFTHDTELSVISYLPAAVNGRLKEVELYTSMDGQNWSLSKTVVGLENNPKTKYFILDSPVKTRFLKIKAKATYGNSQAESNQYFSGKLFMFFEEPESTTDISAIEETKAKQTIDLIKNNLENILKDEDLTTISDITVTNRDLQPVLDEKTRKIANKIKDSLSNVEGVYYIAISNNNFPSLNKLLSDGLIINYKVNKDSSNEYTYLKGEITRN